ncbi:MAG: L,D-transpeptidase family protein, partial [Actinomycetota bacterium]
YKPSYFNGGIAFHGNGSVPAYPASHGCVRLPMPFADWFFNNASSIGTVVYVYGGPDGTNPQPFIADKPAPSPSPSPSAIPSESPSPSPEPSPTESPIEITGTAQG